MTNINTMGEGGEGGGGGGKGGGGRGDRCFEIVDSVPFRYSSTQALFKKCLSNIS